MDWSVAALPRLDGRLAVVTGANSGIGWHIARELAGHGARVMLACRDVERAKQAADRIVAGCADADVEATYLDLADLGTVREFGEGFDQPLDLLVNNAGVMAPRRRAYTRNGFELQFATNHLGHFVLTGLLLPALLRAPAPRVVTVSSIAHHSGGVDVLDANASGPYRPQHAYGNSKLANLLFALELQRQATARESPLTSTAAHPGFAYTGLVTDRQGLGRSGVIRLLAPPFVRAVSQPAAVAARSVLYAAVVAAPGTYTGPQNLHETRGPIGPARMSPLARDGMLGRRLWRASEDLTGFRYPWTRTP